MYDSFRRRCRHVVVRNLKSESRLCNGVLATADVSNSPSVRHDTYNASWAGYFNQLCIVSALRGGKQGTEVDGYLLVPAEQDTHSVALTFSGTT